MTRHHKNNLKLLLSFFFLNLFIFFSHKCFAELQDRICESQFFAQLISIQGELWVDLTGSSEWQLVSQNQLLCEGSRIRVGNNSRASIRLPNNILIRLDEGTVLTLKGIAANQPTLLDLMKGFIHFLSRTPTRLEITTPIANAGPEGTEFAMQVDDQIASLWVYEGSVKFFNKQGNLLLNPGEAAQVQAGEAPHIQMDVKPVDAVQWALYYPAIIDTHVIEQQLPRTLQTNVRESLERYRQGKVFEALSLIEAFDAKILPSQLLTYRAGLYLTFGRIAEAKSDIDLTLQVHPKDSGAYALQAIIAVVQNDKEAALQFSQQAVEIDPTSPTARLALSYAQQAYFQIEEALSSVEEIIRLDSQSALAWARLSELQMSTGYLDRALESAQKAANLNPYLGKTQTVLGFAHLLQIDTQTAKEIFHKAIALGQADPMPRLGLGLALIREGELEAGRIELEIAASLDPANSLIRSYLGKAYFEEKRYPLASTQFDLAKERDPRDPTPWFYDAIQKQTQNRPVEALRDIQKSIELNNNRAAYRSKLLLDRDEAARGSSLARIFENLGFEKRAIMETAKSLSFDPSNHSAHRFLSDAYLNVPRHEIARVSELLQAQLLQPVNVNPVQPHLTVTDLNIITGAGPAAGFNEFTPLVERNKSQLVASGVVGGNSTLGNEVVASAVYGRGSISIGQFHYDSKGFKRNANEPEAPNNNDQKHNIYNIFIQYAVTPKFNIQTELNTRKTEHGDLLMPFASDVYNPFMRFGINQDKARIGARYAISPNQDFILSTIMTHRKNDTNNHFPLDFGAASYIFSRELAYQTEAQYLLRKEYFNITMGGSAYRVDADNRSTYIEPRYSDCSECRRTTLQKDYRNDRDNAYLYSNINFPQNISTTLGFSYDSLHIGRENDVIQGGERFTGYKSGSFNPKFGLQWNITSNLRFRAAWFETVKSALVASQTIEPTQIAGFNQFFDDTNGTESRRKGIGMDASIATNIYSGFEISERNLLVPSIFHGIFNKNENTNIYNKQKEKLYRAYLYWLPHDYWTVKGELQFEKFSRSEKVLSDTGNDPSRIETLKASLGLNYFNPNGVFSWLTGTLVRQELGSYPNLGQATDSKFSLLDAAIGYRLPNRRGIISLEGRNLLDQKFEFWSHHFQYNEQLAYVPRFIPDRAFFVKLTLNY